jgi:hypothetical protein
MSKEARALARDAAQRSFLRMSRDLRLELEAVAACRAAQSETAAFYAAHIYGVKE